MRPALEQQPSAEDLLLAEREDEIKALKAQLIVSLCLGLFAPLRLALTPARSAVASTVYAGTALVLLLAHAACAAICSAAAAGRSEAIDGRWQDIEPLLARSGMWERLSAGCTGNPEPLFEAAALMGLGTVATLSCGATVLLGIVVPTEGLAFHRLCTPTISVRSVLLGTDGRGMP